MTNITTITSAVSAVKNAYDIVKQIRESEIASKSSELKAKMAELLIALADAQVALVERDSRIKDLEAQLKVEKNLIFDGRVFWLNEGSQKSGPFCQRCKDADGKLIHLQPDGTNLWHCKACSTSFRDTAYREKPRHTVGDVWFKTSEW